MVGGQAGPDTGHGHCADSRKCEVFPAGTITCLLPRAEMRTCHDCHALSRCPGSCQAKNLREAGRSFSAARSSWLCWGEQGSRGGSRVQALGRYGCMAPPC